MNLSSFRTRRAAAVSVAASSPRGAAFSTVGARRRGLALAASATIVLIAFATASSARADVVYDGTDGAAPVQPVLSATLAPTLADPQVTAAGQPSRGEADGAPLRRRDRSAAGDPGTTPGGGAVGSPRGASGGTGTTPDAPAGGFGGVAGGNGNNNGNERGDDWWTHGNPLPPPPLQPFVRQFGILYTAWVASGAEVSWPAFVMSQGVRDPLQYYAMMMLYRYYILGVELR